MRGKKLWMIVGSFVAVGAAVLFVQRRNPQTIRRVENNVPIQSASRPTVRESGQPTSPNVPAHYETAPNPAELGSVLPVSQFFGKTREAYEIAKKIPTLLAQMPCYCHCDRGMGHKSLHSCFEDEHAAHCATCVDEALLTYDLQKRGLSAKQIREQIITHFAD